MSNTPEPEKGEAKDAPKSKDLAPLSQVDISGYGATKADREVHSVISKRLEEIPRRKPSLWRRLRKLIGGR